MTRRNYLMPATLLAFLLLADKAMAQAFGGGGGGGLLTAIIQWLATNVLQGIIMLGVIIVGVMLIAGRHTLAGVITMVVGAVIVANYNQISALFPVGG